MKKGLSRILSLILAVVCILPLFSVARAAAEPAPEVASGSALLYHVETGKILYEKNADTRISPAAFTKMMTALLAFEYRREAGNITVTVTEEMLSGAGGTSMRLKAGETLPLDSLLAGLVVQNANDAALVLASVVGGDISSFVDKMNARAKELGMSHSYFANPTGVDSAVMYSTLQDCLILAATLYRVNDFMVVSEKQKATIPATNLTEERVYTNKNLLVPYSYVYDYYMENTRGMVAGFTAGAGYCCATTRKAGDCTYLVLVSGGKDRSEKQNGTDISSYRDAKSLIEWAEKNFAMQSVCTSGEVICEVPVRLAAGVDHVMLVTKGELATLLPVGEDTKARITTAVRTKGESFTAPIAEGESYGEMDVFFDGELIATVPLVALNSVHLSGWLVMWDAVERFFSRGPARVVLILLIAAAVIYVAVLIGTVWVHAARRNRARNQLISEMNRKEDLRMKKVRQEERLNRRARFRRAGVFLREGFRVLSGESEAMDTGSRRSRAPSKAVARVPEKYRKAKLPPPSAAPRRAEKAPRRAAPVRPASKRPAPQKDSLRQKQLEALRAARQRKDGNRK
ncbi:MAG: hypothetical protein IJC84_06595 [Clostridia bacterium]|nr:hypothetical protein [Clostridia bacterium]